VSKTTSITVNQQYDKLYKSILKYEKVQIVIEDGNNSNWNKPNYIKRIITKDGHCKVAYKGRLFSRYSKYCYSCFAEYTDIKNSLNSDHWSNKRAKRSLRRTLQEMRAHDKYNKFKIIEMRIGKGFKIII